MHVCVAIEFLTMRKARNIECADNLKEDLIWGGSSVVVLSPLEQRFLEAVRLANCPACLHVREREREKKEKYILEIVAALYSQVVQRE